MAEQKTTDPLKGQQRKVYLFAALLLIPFSFFMWMIFGAKEVAKPEGAEGINYTVPEGREQKIEGSKQKVVAKVQTEELQAQRLLTLGENSFSLTDNAEPEPQQTTPNSMHEAEEANRALRRQVAGAYTAQHRSDEVERLREQVAQLNERLDAAPQNAALDPLELAERQYQLAQKYLGGTQPACDTTPVKRGHVAKMRPVRREGLKASTLNPAVDVTQERNVGFLTAAGRERQEPGTAIRACVAQTQVVRAGGVVRLRLLEEVSIDGVRLPRNTPLYGQASIEGMRLRIVVHSLEYEGRIFAVEASAYDLDGLPGLNIPDSRERRAVKEALASIGQDVGTSINVTKSAGQQVLSDLTRGTMRATTRYAAEKLKEVKVTLKADHRLYLVSKE